MSARWLLASAIAMASGFGAKAQAQTDPAQESAAPPFADTAPSRIESGEPIATARAIQAEARFTSLHIEIVGDSAGVRWRARAPSPEIEALSPGQRAPMDEQWVRAQFAANGLASGSPMSADRVSALIQTINRAYLENGYVNSGILIDQRTLSSQSELSLRLVFGRVVDPVSIVWGAENGGGARGLGEDYILDRLPAAHEKTFNLFDLEREFRTLAEDPALQTVSADLQPSATSGEAVLHLRVTPQERYDFYVSAANSRSPSVGGERVAIGGSVRNLVLDGSVLSAELGATDGLNDAVLSYAAPLTRRLSFDVRGEINEAEVIDPALRPLDISSESRSVEAGLSYQLIDRPLMPGADAADWRAALSGSVGARVVRKESEAFLLGQPFSFSPGAVDGRTEYSVARLTTDWVARDNEDRLGRVWAFSVATSLGLEGTKSDIPGLPSPDEHFYAMLVQANHARQLSRGGLELHVRLAAQYAGGLLYSGERFAIGGEGTVRGYRENLILADSGALASVELTHPLHLGDGGGDFDWGAFRGTVFADAATVRNEQGAAPDPSSLASVGVSLAWRPSPLIDARITYGHALTDVPPQGEDDLQDDGVHFRVTLRPLELFRDW